MSSRSRRLCWSRNSGTAAGLSNQLGLVTETPAGEDTDIAPTDLGHTIYHQARLSELPDGRAAVWGGPIYSGACQFLEELTRTTADPNGAGSPQD